MVIAVSGARARCGWAEVFPIVESRVASDVCPMFFQLGTSDTLAASLTRAAFGNVRSITCRRPFCTSPRQTLRMRRSSAVLSRWRIRSSTNRHVRRRGTNISSRSPAAYRVGEGYRVPGEFVVGCGEKATPNPPGCRVVISA